MNLIEAHVLMQNNCGIEIGDEVKVLRIANGKELGWGNIWDKHMDNTVGECGTVKEINPCFGILVEFVKYYDESCSWWYPWFVLEVVKPSCKKVKKMKWKDVKVGEIVWSGKSKLHQVMKIHTIKTHRGIVYDYVYIKDDSYRGFPGSLLYPDDVVYPIEDE